MAKFYTKLGTLNASCLKAIRPIRVLIITMLVLISNSTTVIFEPVCEKTSNLDCESNQAVQSQKKVRDWKFGIWKVEELYLIHVAKTKALTSFAVTAKLICTFVFAYADCWFSHAAAHLLFRALE